MSKELKQVIRFHCPECQSKLQGEVDDEGDFVVSVYEKGQPKPNDPAKKSKGSLMDLLFSPPKKPGVKADDVEPGGGE